MLLNPVRDVTDLDLDEEAFDEITCTECFLLSGLLSRPIYASSSAALAGKG